ncbi:MAG: 50S ribosomal protein L11 methyltransferase [Lentisphaerota bacterium]
MPSKEKIITTLLTLEVEAGKAEHLSGVIRKNWGLEPVEIQRPGDSRRIWLDLYFHEEAQARLAGKVLGGAAGVRGALVKTYTPRDWELFYRRHFQRRPVGERLEICPAWESRSRRARKRKRILVNPGMSFGTGDHFTTHFCLEQIDHLLGERKRGSFLDVGTGSGILAIAAARMGCPRVLAVDSDPECVVQTKNNLKLNRICKGVQVRLMDLNESVLKGPFDVVCANLFSSLLLAQAPLLMAWTRHDLILSGVREHEADAVADAMVSLGGREMARDGNGEWAGLVIRKSR